jgi:signal transduction histidine kinase
VGRSGGVDPAAPDRIAADRITPSNATGDPLSGGDTTLLPILVPAIASGTPTALIRLRRPGGPPPRGGPLLDAVGQLAADALERVRLDAARKSAADEAGGTARRLSILGGLALELVGGTTVTEVAATLLGFAVDDLGAGFAAVHVADDVAGGFRLVDARGYPAGLVAAGAIVAADAPSPVTRAAASREPLEIVGEDGWRTAFPRTSNVPAITGVAAISAIPMVAAAVVQGVLTIGWRTAGDRSVEDRDLLAAAAAQGAQALERAILHAHDEDARRFQEAFIGVVSHELRTPITTILAGSRLLRRRLAEDAQSRDLSDDIEIEADRLTRIVDDLLVLSRLERRHLTVGDDPVHLDHLLARVVASESPRWPDHRFEIPTSPSRHVVRGEDTYVEQVLRNLISNAAKYSPVGSTVRIAVDDAPDGEVEVRVLDEGPGIAPGEVDELFSLFYRSPTTAAAAAGAGIGLFVSRRLVTEMGGRVWARPRPDGGSEFGFSLASYPIDELEADDDDDVPAAG